MAASNVLPPSSHAGACPSPNGELNSPIRRMANVSRRAVPPDGLAPARSALALRLVEGDCVADEGLEGLLVERFALPEVDGAPGVAVEAGVEQASLVVKGRALGERHLHVVLVALAGA